MCIAFKYVDFTVRFIVYVFVPKISLVSNFGVLLFYISALSLTVFEHKEILALPFVHPLLRY